MMQVQMWALMLNSSPVVPAGVAQTLQGIGRRQRIGREAAILFGCQQALDAELGTFIPTVPVERGFSIGGDHVSIKFLAAKTNDRRAKLGFARLSTKNPRLHHFLFRIRSSQLVQLLVIDFVSRRLGKRIQKCEDVGSHVDRDSLGTECLQRDDREFLSLVRSDECLDGQVASCTAHGDDADLVDVLTLV